MYCISSPKLECFILSMVHFSGVFEDFYEAAHIYSRIVFLLQYEGINIPYPVDKTDMLKQIEADQKSAVSEFDCSALPSWQTQQFMHGSS